MAPEQGPDSKSKAEKTKRIASDEESVPISDNNQQNTLTIDNIGWIYLLRKEKLVEQCRNVGIATAGYTVEHLRKKLADMLRTKQIRASSENLLREAENEVKLSENTIVHDEVVFLPIPPTSSRPVVPNSDVMCTVQKWNLRFSGDSDLMEFLERIEELAECYQIHTDQLLPAMLEVLNGNALKWYRVKRSEIRCWDKFRAEIQKFFLPKRYLSQLEQSFYTRRQNNRERAKDFILSMLTLARQHPDLRNRDHLDRIYDGLRTEYKHYVRRNDFCSLDDLISMTDEFEALKREDRPQPTHTITTIKYDRNEACWRCKERGHRRHSCTNERRLFCSYCGRDGTFSTSCGCRDTKVDRPDEEDTRYYIDIAINGLTIRALVDTGATKTHISERVANHLISSGVPIANGEEPAEMADRSVVNPSGRFRVRIFYKHRSVALHVSEIPTLAEDVILGMDFLAAYGIEIRLGGENLPPADTKHSFVRSLTSYRTCCNVKRRSHHRTCKRHSKSRTSAIRTTEPAATSNVKPDTEEAVAVNTERVAIRTTEPAAISKAKPETEVAATVNTESVAIQTPTSQPKYNNRRRRPNKPAFAQKAAKIDRPLSSALDKCNRKLAERSVGPSTAVDDLTSKTRKPLTTIIHDFKPPPIVFQHRAKVTFNDKRSLKSTPTSSKAEPERPHEEKLPGIITACPSNRPRKINTSTWDIFLPRLVSPK